MAIAAAQFGLVGASEAGAAASRELTALGRAKEWLNSPPLTSSSLAGNVVLVNFWTRTCINWLRTLPYVRSWSQQYRNGLVVVGVHTPEFAFERDVDGVRRAVQERRIDYPVVIDNDTSIWRAFGNRAWPALYFIDAHGRVRQRYFGEGEYERSELAIQRLLTEAGVTARSDGTGSVDAGGVEAPADWRNLKSPETYLGFERTERFASPGGPEADRRHRYAIPARLALNQWALDGEWTIGRQATAVNGPSGRLQYRFHARDLHLVMGPPRQGTAGRFRVSIDGQPPGAAHGLDIDEAGNGTVAEARLYQLIRQPAPIVDRLFAIEFLDPGAQTFVLTFG
jgi:thiol-disulfide isomerase/thioredoxin